jgi:hypothetical protein
MSKSGCVTLVLVLVLALAGVRAARADQAPGRQTQVAASVGILGGLGIGGAHSEAGLEGALWVGTGGRANQPTRGIGLDAGWTSKTEYAELEASAGFSAVRDGEGLVGLAAGVVHDRTRGRWGGQATAFAALVPCFIFPYVRAEKLGSSAPAVSVGLMVKALVPVYYEAHSAKRE